MRKYFYIILFFFFAVQNKAQTYFNYRFNFPEPPVWSGATTAIVFPDGYGIFGVCGSEGNYFWHRIGLIKIDFNGNVVLKKTYGDTISEFFFGDNDYVANISDTSLFAVGTKDTYINGKWLQEGMLLSFNNFFDTLFSRTYGDIISPIDTATIFRQIKVVGNSFIIVGQLGLKSPKTDFLLMKTDFSGNVIFKKNYGAAEIYDGTSVICTDDGGYAMGGGFWRYEPDPNWSGDPIVIKTDSIGNQQWIKNLGGMYPDCPAFLTNGIDGTILVGTCYCDSLNGGGPTTTGNPYRRINLVKIDNSGTIVWNKKYGKSEYYKRIYSIRTNLDGTIISSGKTHPQPQDGYTTYGWILKTTSDGDSIWYREYAICEGDFSENWLYDAIETPDNGYLACGVVYPMPPDTGSQDGWILKVDSLGCTAPGECWVGQEEIEVREFTPDKPFVFYPNPANEKLTIEFHENPSGAEIELYDLTGRKAVSDKIAPNKPLIEMDVGKLPPGLYILKVTIPGKRPVMGKVVVE